MQRKWPLVPASWNWCIRHDFRTIDTRLWDGSLNLRTSPTPGTASQPSLLRDIPPGIWALGFVSLLMDISSEMIHALLPVYLVTVLATSMVTVGIIEGIAEAT